MPLFSFKKLCAADLEALFWKYHVSVMYEGGQVVMTGNIDRDKLLYMFFV